MFFNNNNSDNEPPIHSIIFTPVITPKNEYNKHMNVNNKNKNKNKNNVNILDEYMAKITSNVVSKIKNMDNDDNISNRNIIGSSKKRGYKLTISEKEIIDIRFQEYDNLLIYDYKTQHLKAIAKKYAMKLSGNKQDLIQRLYPFLYLSHYSSIIQRRFRGNLSRKYVKLHGPAFFKREICNNTYDFFSMDELSNIPKEQFFSYKDDNNFVYGFDILSFQNLIQKTSSENKDVVKNPYTNETISSIIIREFEDIIRISKVLKINICTELEDISKEVSIDKMTQLRALALFQYIDALGNYSDSNWFLCLSQNRCIKFYNELLDIWQYRAPLSLEVKKNICPPLGTPFIRTGIFLSNLNLNDLRNYLLTIMEKLVTTGIDKDSKCLGAYYVLGALTLVSEPAATSLPWLYQAVCYI